MFNVQWFQHTRGKAEVPGLAVGATVIMTAQMYYQRLKFYNGGEQSVDLGQCFSTDLTCSTII